MDPSAPINRRLLLAAKRAKAKVRAAVEERNEDASEEPTSTDGSTPVAPEDPLAGSAEGVGRRSINRSELLAKRKALMERRTERNEERNDRNDADGVDWHMKYLQQLSMYEADMGQMQQTMLDQREELERLKGEGQSKTPDAVPSSQACRDELEQSLARERQSWQEQEATYLAEIKSLANKVRSLEAAVSSGQKKCEEWEDKYYKLEQEHDELGERFARSQQMARRKSVRTQSIVQRSGVSFRSQSVRSKWRSALKRRNKLLAMHIEDVGEGESQDGGMESIVAAATPRCLKSTGAPTPDAEEPRSDNSGEAEAPRRPTLSAVKGIAHSFVNRHRLKKAVKEYRLSPSAKAGRARNSVIRELMTTEQAYIKALHVLVKQFVRPLRAVCGTKNEVIPMANVSAIFGDLESILLLHRTFLKELQKRMSDSTGAVLLGDLFQSISPALVTYSSYITNYDDGSLTLNSCRSQDKFGQFLAQRERTEASNWLDLESLRIMPVQRLPRYSLLLQSLLEHTHQAHTDYGALQKAHSEITSMITKFNSKKKKAEDRRLLEEIRAQFDKPDIDLMGASSCRLTYQTQAILQKAVRQVQFKVFVFSNGIVLAKIPAGRKYLSLKVSIPIDEVIVTESPADSPMLQFDLNNSCTEAKPLRLRFANVAEKESCADAILSSRVAAWEKSRSSSSSQGSEGQGNSGKLPQPPPPPQKSVSAASLGSLGLGEGLESSGESSLFGLVGETEADVNAKIEKLVAQLSQSAKELQICSRKAGEGSDQASTLLQAIAVDRWMTRRKLDHHLHGYFECRRIIRAVKKRSGSRRDTLSDNGGVGFAAVVAVVQADQSNISTLKDQVHRIDFCPCPVRCEDLCQCSMSSVYMDGCQNKLPSLRESEWYRNNIANALQ